MTTSLQIHRTLLGTAALILLATAILHATGLSSVSATLEGSGLPAGWAEIFEGLWLMFSIHLAVVAALLVALAAFPAGRAPLAVAAAMPLADTVLLLVTVGVFVGSILTGAATLLVMAALAMRSRAAGESR